MILVSLRSDAKGFAVHNERKERDRLHPNAYWVWLQHGLGPGSTKIKRILSLFHTIQNFYEAGEYEWRLSGCFTQRELAAFSSYSLEEAQALVEYCQRVGQQVLTPEDEAFPPLLRQIHPMPCALYVLGSLPDWEVTPAIAVVGTRDATESGKQIAFEFGYQLAKCGATVVSGGALGIDTAAHKGALQAGGKTLCVLGCGIGYGYLMENASLREAISGSGALISEFPVNTPPRKATFPVRNRLISGLCQGILVVEAASKSGSLITAQAALEQNRDVFAVPCDIHNPVSQGANRLIQTGAKAVTCVEDILEEYRSQFPSLKWLEPASNPVEKQKKSIISMQRKSPEKAPELPVCKKSLPRESFSSEAQLVWEHLEGEPKAIARLEEETGLPSHRLLSALTELELAGRAASYSGRRYGISEN